uniref:Uncharacterized protein n=1 Tax=Nelumbo nucifera TaxID=4432 RepID=A0A822Y8W0_NELNU|nr:TPA_asm: hypothetical protein HUJ06_029971 [Nelumbo nucifera]
MNYRKNPEPKTAFLLLLCWVSAAYTAQHGRFYVQRTRLVESGVHDTGFVGCAPTLGLVFLEEGGGGGGGGVLSLLIVVVSVSAALIGDWWFLCSIRCMIGYGGRWRSYY